MASFPGNVASPRHGLPPPPPPPHPDDAVNAAALEPPRKKRRPQHAAPSSSCFPNVDTSALRSLPPLGSPSLGGVVQAQQQQQHHRHPFPFLGLETALPIRVGPPLSFPSPHAANCGCPPPPQHLSSSVYLETHHTQSTPSPAYVAALGNHAYLSHGDYGAVNSCPGEQKHPHLPHLALPVHGSLPGGDAVHFSAPALPQVFMSPHPDALPSSSTSVFSAEGTGSGGHALPPSFSFHGEFGGDAYAGEIAEGWDLRSNQYPVGGAGGVTTRGPKAGFGWLRYGAATNTDWSKEEQAILEGGMNEYASQPKLLQYAQISYDLQGRKTTRDVALRCKYYTDIIGGWSVNSLPRNLDAPEEGASQNDGLFGGNDDRTKQLFEQNDLIFKQIAQNQKSLKLQTEDIINLFDSAYSNIWKLHSSLNNGTSEGASEYLKRLNPLHNMFRLLKPPQKS